MSKHLVREDLGALAQVVETPKFPTIVDRSFELPVAIYAMTVGAYLAFLAVMAAAFATGALLIPMAIFVVYIAMAFGVPMMWTRMRPDAPQHALRWADFRRNGVMTATGRLGGGEAAAQVLMLPALILAWGLAVAVIAAVV